MNGIRYKTRTIIKSLNLVVVLFTVYIITSSSHPFAKVKMVREDNIDISWDKFSEGGSIRATYYTDLQEIPMNQIHSWRLILEEKDGSVIDEAEVVISPDMPEHLHGMTTKPVISPTGNSGEYLIEGMNFHMPGWWEVTLDVTTPRTRDLVRFQLIIGEHFSTGHAKCD